MPAMRCPSYLRRSSPCLVLPAVPLRSGPFQVLTRHADPAMRCLSALRLAPRCRSCGAMPLPAAPIRSGPCHACLPGRSWPILSLPRLACDDSSRQSFPRHAVPAVRCEAGPIRAMPRLACLVPATTRTIRHQQRFADSHHAGLDLFSQSVDPLIQFLMTLRGFHSLGIFIGLAC